MGGGEVRNRPQYRRTLGWLREIRFWPDLLLMRRRVGCSRLRL